MKKHIQKLEIIQRVVTKVLQELKGLMYEERLKEIELITQEERERADLITIHKLVKQMGKVDNEDLLLTRDGKSREMRGHNRCM